MDIQMPQKDGYAAAREIRTFEKQTGNRAVIISLTAGTVKGEKERCLEAGMDDYLSKPVVEENIRKILSSWIEPKEDGENKSRHFDRRSLVRDLTSDEVLLKELIAETKNALPKRLQSLQKALRKGDFGEVRTYAHSLKGISLNMKFYRLADIAKQIETKADEAEKRSDIQPLVDQLQEEAGVVLELL